MKEFWLWLQVTLNPSWWVRIKPVNKDWDHALREAVLDERNKFKNIDRYTVDVGNISIWIANYPYSYGSPHKPDALDILPTRRTALLLRKRIRKLERARDLRLTRQHTQSVRDACKDVNEY